MLRSVVLLVAFATLSAGTTLLQPVVRQNPEDVIGFFQPLIPAISMTCPRLIRHSSTVMDGVIPHTAIRMNARRCPDGEEMSVFTDLDAANDQLTDDSTRMALADYRSAVDGLIVGIELSGRDCEDVPERLSDFSPGTLVMIFTLGDTAVLVGGVSFPPNRTYMVIVDPERSQQGDSFCFYRRLIPSPSPSPFTEMPPIDPSVVPVPGGMTSTPEPTEEPPAPGGGPGPGSVTMAPTPTDDEMSMDMSMSPEVSPSIEVEEAGDGDGDDDDDDDDDDDPVCFPEDGIVELEDGTLKQMRQVVIGDRVKVADGFYSDVFMFTHKDAGRAHKFVQIDTMVGARLSVTSGHYIYINGHITAAGLAKVGDVVELGDGQTTLVTDVTTVRKTGLYNPQTVHGDIIVNSIRASTYTRVLEPPMAQAMMAPLRVVYRALGWSVANFDKGADSIADFLPRGQEIL